MRYRFKLDILNIQQNIKYSIFVVYKGVSFCINMFKRAEPKAARSASMQMLSSMLKESNCRLKLTKEIDASSSY